MSKVYANDAYAMAMQVDLSDSKGMLQKAKKKDPLQKVLFITADAAVLPFANDLFDVVACSHALYELKGAARISALKEMKRVVKPGSGTVFIMEHEKPTHPLTKLLFKIRIKMVGSSDAGAFLDAGLVPFKEIFPAVNLSRSPSGKSRLLRCTK